MKLAEVYNKQYENKVSKPPEENKKESKQVNLVVHMPEISLLIKHLDLLYSKMLINEEQKDGRVSWYNPR